MLPSTPYLGRLAPSPTGYLHLGHARTFALAAARARAVGGRLLLRIDDLDAARCRPQFTAAALEDLAWLGLSWELPVLVQSARSRGIARPLATCTRPGRFIPATALAATLPPRSPPPTNRR